VTRDGLSGIDYAWLAVDSIGNVAVFTTGGEGPVPTSALPTLELAESAIRDLVERSACEMQIKIPRPDDYVSFAKRGLFAYDWYDVHRESSSRINQYELLARPTNPVTLGELPDSFRVLVAPTIIVGVTFGAAHVPQYAIAV
jgi:hypothetical protein